MNKNEWSGHSAPTGTEPTELDDYDLLAQSKYSVSPQQAKQMSFLPPAWNAGSRVTE